MAAVVIATIIALAGIAAWVGSRLAPPHERPAWIGGGVGGLVVAGIVVIAASVTTVPAHTVGVVTEFGRYQGVLNPGWHMLAPWADVEEFGTRIQPLDLPDVPIRFGGNSGGSADLLVEWRVETADEAAIKRLWQDYRTFAAIQTRLVHASARSALNVVMAGYTPSEGVSGTALQPITDATLTGIRERLTGTGVVVERVTIRQIDPDPQSQARIDRQVQAQADLERTAVTEQIAEREARIAATRQRSQTPSSLTYECLRILADWDHARQGPIPPALDCSLTGGESPALIVGR